MKSIIKSRQEVDDVGRDSPGFFLYGLGSNKIKQWKTLDQVAEVVRRTFTASKYPESEFYHIGVTDIDNERGQVINIDRCFGKNIKGGKVVFQGGDIIFARIEPSIYNKKTAIVPDVGDCLGSTEFLVARPKENISPEYILWALRSKWVQEQILGKMTGSTGRRRFEETDFAKLQLPWPEKNIREKIVNILISAQSKYMKLLKEAAETLRKGENLVIELLESDEALTFLIDDCEIESDIVENKWNDLEKLYLPNSGNQLDIPLES